MTKIVQSMQKLDRKKNPAWKNLNKENSYYNTKLELKNFTLFCWIDVKRAEVTLRILSLFQ